MPEAAKEIPSSSDAATMATPNEDAKPEDKVQQKDEESESESKVTGRQGQSSELEQSYRTI